LASAAFSGGGGIDVNL